MTPVFIVLVFGIIEFGQAYANYLSLGNLVTTAARQEAIQGNNMSADWLTLQSIKSAKNVLSISKVQRIVVFEATGPTDSVPTACKTASQNVGGLTTPSPGSCNRFTATEWNDVNGPSWTCSSNAIKNYCPAYRTVTVAGSPDYVGIWIEARHDFITGLFGRSLTLTDTAITRLEPQRLG